MNKPKISQSPNETPGLSITLNTRHLAYIALTAAATLGTTACGDDVVPKPPARGVSCVTVLDQENQPMTGCKFDYKVPQSLLDENQDYYERYGVKLSAENPCEEDELFVYERPGTKKINAKCENDDSHLVGHVNVDINKDGKDHYSSHLINSFCTDNYKFIATPQEETFMMNDHLGRSTDTWCANKLSSHELVRTEVVDILLDCNNQSNCDPLNGRDLLMPQGEPGQFSEGQPKHLTFRARTDLVDDSHTATVMVKLKQKDTPIQEFTVPVDIKGSVCGNGLFEHKEECEGSDFKGKTCENLGFASGNLECNNCQISTDNCVKKNTE